MSKTVAGTMYDGVRGGEVEFGTMSVNPITIAAGAEAETTIAFADVATGDLVFANPRALTAGLVFKGARVTAAGVMGVTLRNATTVAIDGAAITYDYAVIKLS